jgi:serine/threonine-protein kinase
LITPDGKVKITDFGIARVGDQVPLTKTGQVMGTVQYLAPEQATGKTSTPATDLYSLGVVAYEALAGKRPFTGENQMAIAMAHINEMPPALPETIDPRVQNLVLSCLAKKPSQRPESATSLAIRAEALLREKRKPGFRASTSTETSYIEQSITEVIPTDTAPLPRAPIVWPWLATVGLLGITAIVVIVAILSDPNTENLPTQTPTSTEQTTPSQSATVSEVATESPEATSELILRSDIIGENLSIVTARLAELGMRVNAIPGTEVEAGSAQARTVYAVSPTGNITIGSVIDVTYYVEKVEESPVVIPEPGTTESSTISDPAAGPTEEGSQG